MMSGTRCDFFEHPRTCGGYDFLGYWTQAAWSQPKAWQQEEEQFHDNEVRTRGTQLNLFVVMKLLWPSESRVGRRPSADPEVGAISRCRRVRLCAPVKTLTQRWISACNAGFEGSAAQSGLRGRHRNWLLQWGGMNDRVRVAIMLQCACTQS